MLVTRNSVSLTRFIAPPGKPVFGILASQRGGPLDRDLALKWLTMLYSGHIRSYTFNQSRPQKKIHFFKIQGLSTHENCATNKMQGLLK